MNASAKKALENVKETIEILKRGLELGTGVISGTPYIVQVGGLSIDPEVVDSKTTGNFKFGLPCRVRRFTERDARTVAETVVNGRGDKGVAVSWIDATEELLESLESLVKTVKK